MKTLFIALPILGACAYLCGCAGTQYDTRIVGGGHVGVPQTQPVGNMVLQVVSEKGSNYIMSTTRYAGVSNDGKALFQNELINSTTIHHPAVVIPNTVTTQQSGDIDVNLYGSNGGYAYGSGSYSGTSTTELPPTIIPGRPPETFGYAGKSVTKVDLAKKPAQFTVLGKYTLTILEADNTSIRYILSEIAR